MEFGDLPNFVPACQMEAFPAAQLFIWAGDEL